jgi:hypothetical protein
MKARFTALAAGLLCASVLPLAQVASAAEPFKGNWALSSSEQPGMVHFALTHRMGGGHSNHSTDWPAGEFLGLDLSAKGKREVTFHIARDAGRFDCEGYLNDGEGAGLFTFTANAQYPKDMAALGFAGIDEQKQFAMAVTDVTVDYARQIKRENLTGLDTDKLIAFRIFNVTSQFIHGLRAEGLAATDSDKLIAFRVHGVTPAQVRAVRNAGLDTSEDMLIAFRVHGVSPEFIDKVRGLGFDKPSSDQLVAMRVHGVTPEFISRMQSRGIKDLTIDKMINLKVHGID